MRLQDPIPAVSACLHGLVPHPAPLRPCRVLFPHPLQVYAQEEIFVRFRFRVKLFALLKRIYIYIGTYICCRCACAPEKFPLSDAAAEAEGISYETKSGRHAAGREKAMKKPRLSRLSEKEHKWKSLGVPKLLRASRHFSGPFEGKRKQKPRVSRSAPCPYMGADTPGGTESTDCTEAVSHAGHTSGEAGLPEKDARYARYARYDLYAQHAWRTQQAQQAQQPRNVQNSRKRRLSLLAILPLFSLLAAAAAFILLPGLPTREKGSFMNRLSLFIWPLCIALISWGIQPLADGPLRVRFPPFPRLSYILAFGGSGILLLLQLRQLYTMLFPSAWSFPAEYAALLGLALFTAALGIYVLSVIGGNRA